MVLSRREALALSAGALLFGGRPTKAADTYPSRIVKLVVPFPAGGSVDPPTRAIAEFMSNVAGHRFLVENRVGAGGNLGADAVAKAAPDGYTLLAANNSMTASQAIYPKLPWDAARDFTYICNLVTAPSAVVVNSSRVSARTLPDLIALAASREPALTYGSPGTGSVSHFAAEMLKEHVGLKMRHVPYRGSAPALTDLLGGVVDVVVTAVGTVLPLLPNDAIRVIAVTGTERMPQLPEVSTIAETKPGYSVLGWLGLAGPAGMPPDVTTRIAGWARTAIQDPTVAQLLIRMGAQPGFIDGDAVRRIVLDELATYPAIVKRAGINPE